MNVGQLVPLPVPIQMHRLHVMSHAWKDVIAQKAYSGHLEAVYHVISVGAREMESTIG